MYKQEGLQEQEVGVKKGFAPFKPQRRKKKDKSGDAKSRPEDDAKAKQPKQPKQVKQVKQETTVVSTERSTKPKTKTVEVINKGARGEKGPPANAPVPTTR